MQLSRYAKNHLKWLDLRGLATAFLKHSQESLQEVYFFTAYPTWLEDSYKRHRVYVQALQESNVEVIIGKFKQKNKKCNTCGSKWVAHEEKESDVNLAIKLISLAYNDTFDKAFLVTADSDICPAIDLVLTHFPNKEISVLVPPNRYSITRELRSLKKINTYKIKEKHIANNRLAEKNCPVEYKLPITTVQINELEFLTEE